MQGAAPLLLQHVMNGSMQDGVWQPTDPAPDSLEFAAARALHTLHPGAPDTGLWHAGLWQTVSLLEDSGAAAVQLRAVKAVRQLAVERIPDDLTHPKTPEERALLFRQLDDLDLARSVRLLLLVRAGAIPRLLSLVQVSPNSLVCYQALRPLSSIAGSPADCAARCAAEMIAAGAMPILLPQAGSSSDNGGITAQQHTAMRALISLAEHSTEHGAALQPILVSILVGWLQTCQDDSDVNYAALLLTQLVSHGDAACRAAMAGAVAALRQHSEVGSVPIMLLDLQHRLQAFEPYREQP